MDEEQKINRIANNQSPKQDTASQSDGILLTSSSSRRKMAWKKLLSNTDNRGMTQEQVGGYLDSYIKQYYKKIRKEGALTYDKVEHYLKYLSKMASKTLIQIETNLPKVKQFAIKVEPIIEDVGSKTTITDEDVAQYVKEIHRQARLQLKEKADPDSLNDSDSKQQIPAKMASATDEFLKKEIIPIGLEDGAPKISVGAFFSFPLSANEEVLDEKQPFAMHIRYLELAAGRNCLNASDLDAIRQRLTTFPLLNYKRYFNIFPDNEYDDAQLMIVYIQWKNGVLKKLTES